jgi:hypothetical protein
MHYTFTVDYSPVYYWIIDETLTVLASGSLTLPTTGSNAVGWVMSSDNTCHLLQIELNTTYSTRSSLIYINTVRIDKIAILGVNPQGFVPATAPFNYLVISYVDTFTFLDTSVTFCPYGSTSTADCDSSRPGSATIPPGGALFLMNIGLTSGAPVNRTFLSVFTPTGIADFGILNDDEFDFDLSSGDDDPKMILTDYIGVGMSAVVAALLLLSAHYRITRKQFTYNPL